MVLRHLYAYSLRVVSIVKKEYKKGRLVRPFLLPCINIRYNTSLIFHQKPIDDQHTPKTLPDPAGHLHPSY